MVVSSWLLGERNNTAPYGSMDVSLPVDGLARIMVDENYFKCRA